MSSPPRPTSPSAGATPSARGDDEWIEIAFEGDLDALRAQALALEVAWPGRYEVRVAPIDRHDTFGLSVRHLQ